MGGAVVTRRLYLFWGGLDLLYLIRLFWLNLAIGRVPLYDDIQAFGQLHEPGGYGAVWQPVPAAHRVHRRVGLPVSAGQPLRAAAGLCQVPLRLLLAVPSLSFIPWLLHGRGAEPVAQPRAAAAIRGVEGRHPAPVRGRKGLPPRCVALRPIPPIHHRARPWSCRASQPTPRVTYGNPEPAGTATRTPSSGRAAEHHRCARRQPRRPEFDQWLRKVSDGVVTLDRIRTVAGSLPVVGNIIATVDSRATSSPCRRPRSADCSTGSARASTSSACCRRRRPWRRRA